MKTFGLAAVLGLAAATPALAVPVTLDISNATATRSVVPSPDDWPASPLFTPNFEGSQRWETSLGGFRVQVSGTNASWPYHPSDPLALGGLRAMWYPTDHGQVFGYRFTRPDGQPFDLTSIDFQFTVSETFLWFDRSASEEYMASLEPGSEAWIYALDRTQLDIFGAYYNVGVAAETADGASIVQTFSSYGEKRYDILYEWDSRPRGASFGPAVVTTPRFTGLTELTIHARHPVSGQIFAGSPDLREICLPQNTAGMPPHLEFDAFCAGRPFAAEGPMSPFTRASAGMYTSGDLDNGVSAYMTGITFDVPEVAQVPLPAGWLLLGGALAALGAARRRG